MSEIEQTKEVYFDFYCPKCEYDKLSESEDPCWNCLENPYNDSSHKPTYFKEKENRK